MSAVFTEKLPSDPLSSPTSCRGFTFVEVIVSMAVTVIVMGAIFGLLAHGFRTTAVEFERSDLQAQARSALDQISRDLLLAGTGLPPEFPAFTPPRVNPELDASGGGPEAIEIVGFFDQSAAGMEPVAIVSFDGKKVRTEVLPTHIEQGDLVLVFDDQPTKGTWLFGLVSSIDMVSSGSERPIQELTIKTQPGESEGDVTLPSFIDHYNRPAPASGFITPLTVVSYRTAPNDSGAGGGEVLWRQVNWGEPTQVALVEDLQFRYFIGGTVDDIGIPPIGPQRPFAIPSPG
ncbi:MAG TPA: prepilin-type N-terminal cleavage/methylation domain-containing protein, partial [Vicinamibacteria bacterium]|nr:prepilin-type N-terminal cleavage/methylation domain-containing protein [Vicinamibacteria bacterium]